MNNAELGWAEFDISWWSGLFYDDDDDDMTMNNCLVPFLHVFSNHTSAPWPLDVPYTKSSSQSAVASILKHHRSRIIPHPTRNTTQT